MLFLRQREGWRDGPTCAVLGPDRDCGGRGQFVDHSSRGQSNCPWAPKGHKWQGPATEAAGMMFIGFTSGGSFKFQACCFFWCCFCSLDDFWLMIWNVSCDSPGFLKLRGSWIDL